MRKRLIIINSLLLVIALIISVVFNAIFCSNLNYNQTKVELKDYLDIALNSYDGDNNDYVINLFNNLDRKIRVTLIDNNGTVIADNYSLEINTNHLNREEIKNLGTFVQRNSQTIGVDMLYVAGIREETYIRVAVELSSVNSYLLSFLISEGITIFVILGLSILAFIVILKKYLAPLSNAADKLVKITNTPAAYNDNSIEALVYYIENVSEILDEQVIELKSEREKVYYIINNISQGLIIIDKNQNIELINNYAIKVLNLLELDVINKNYLYAFRNNKIVDDINLAIKEKKASNEEETINGYTYQIAINAFDDKVSVIISDITKIKNLENTKREFFQNASHELKSPLTSIIGYQQMIKEGIISEESEIQDATSKTIREANRMNQIIIEMLELSKLESEVSFEMTTINISSAVKEAISTLETKAENKKIFISTNLDDSSIYGNYEHVFTIIKNIVENSIKYNKEEGSIIITLDNKQLTIEDTGIGIEKKNISRIFERFYRVDKAKSKELGSTGLGLAIVKHIAKMYDYRIDVTSDVGIGTKFTILFK